MTARPATQYQLWRLRYLGARLGLTVRESGWTEESAATVIAVMAKEAGHDLRIVHERCPGSDCLPNGPECHWCGADPGRYGEAVYGTQYPDGPLRGRLRPHDVRSRD